MPFNINSFRSTMAKGGARPNLFQVTLTPPAYAGAITQPLSFMCKAAAIPELTVGVVELGYWGRKVKFAGNRTFAEWQLTVYNDEDFLIRDAFERWSNAISSITTNDSVQRTGGATSAPSSYVVNASVTQFTKDGKAASTYNFVNVWPSVVSSIELDWDTNDSIETYTVTLQYDYYVKAGVTT